LKIAEQFSRNSPKHQKRIYQPCMAAMGGTDTNLESLTTLSCPSSYNPETGILESTANVEKSYMME